MSAITIRLGRFHITRVSKLEQNTFTLAISFSKTKIMAAIKCLVVALLMSTVLVGAAPRYVFFLFISVIMFILLQEMHHINQYRNTFEMK